MAEITKANGLDEYVKDSIYKFGEVTPFDIVEYEFEFLGDPDDIGHVEKSCGCTSAYFKDGKIKGQLNIQQAQRNYEKGENPMNKYIFVYLNDGQPRFIADQLKQRQINPEKKFFKLQLAGTVVKE